MKSYTLTDIFFKYLYSISKSFFLLVVLFTSLKSNSQCNIGNTATYSNPVNCSTYTKQLGAGEYGTMNLTQGVSYYFSLSSSALVYSNGVCINGVSGNYPVTYTAPSTGGYTVGTNRINNGFNYNSATLIYYPITPALPSAISGPTTVCSGALNVTYSVTAAANVKDYTWEYSVDNGNSYVSITNSGSNSVSFNWPDVVTNSAFIRVKAQNGPCITGWQNLNVKIVEQPTVPTSAPKSPNLDEICLNDVVGITGAATGGIDQGCTLEYRYSIDGGTIWSAASIVEPTGLSSSIKGVDRIIIQARRVNCSTFGCNSTAWNTVAKWTVDVIAPTVVTKDITVNLDPTGAYTLSNTAVDDGSTDNCLISSYSVSPNTFNCSNVGDNTVTLTVTDNAGNFATQTAVVTVVDVTPPNVLTQNIFTQLDASGQASITPAMINNGSTDACGILSYSLDKDTFDCDDYGINTVTLTVTDVNGNVATQTATVNVQDLIPPVIVSNDITLELDEYGSVSLTPDMIDAGSSDNCDITLFTIPSSFTCSDVGPNTVLIIATDTGDNVRFASCIVTIVDNILPTITPPANISVNAGPTCITTGLALGTPVTDDNCNVASVTNDAPTNFPAGITTVVWTVTDVNGNTDTANQIVTVLDRTDPTISAPPVIEISADASCGAISSAIDFGLVTNDNCSVASTTHNGPAVFPLGLTSITWTVTDGAGNTATINQTINVIDDTLPTITAPVDVNVNANASCNATGVVLGLPITGDNCTVASVINNAPSEFPIGTTEVIWTVTDAAGNANTATQNVIVNDVTNPVITCVSNAPITKNNSLGVCGYTAVGTEFDPTFTDNCDNVVLTHDFSSWSNANTLAGATFPIGTTTVIWTATDAGGNTSTCTLNIIVTDNEAPVMQNCPSNQALTVGQYSCGTTPNWVAPLATDNCDSVSVVQTSGPLPTDTLAVGTYTIVYTATDSSNNTSTCSFQLNVIASSDPIITCPNDVVLKNTSPNSCFWISPALSLKPIQAIGNCPTVTWEVLNPDASIVVGTTSDVSGYSFAVGTSTVTYTITDSTNNSTSCSFTVTVQDVEVPTITAPSNIVLNPTSTCTATGVVLGTPATSDNCTIVAVTNNAPVEFPLGTTTVTWTVEDSSGNLNTAIQTVTVLDSQAPVFTFSAGQNITKSNTLGDCGYTTQGAEFNPTATDNCQLASLVHNYTSANSNTSLSGAVFPVGVTAVVWTATDVNGNISTYTLNITVTDDEAPEFENCPTNQILTIGLYASACNGAPTNWAIPQATDNCSTVTVTQTAGPSATSTLTVGLHQIIYKAEDAAGNTSFCTFYVNVINTTNPIIVCTPNVTKNVDANSCNWISPAGSLSPFQAVGNCITIAWEVENPDGTEEIGSSDVSGYIFAPGISTVTYTVTDADNNTQTCSFTVTVVDNILPNIAAPADIDIQVAAGCSVPTINLGTPVVSDNCSNTVVSNDAPPVFQIGTTVVTWKVIDVNGNSSTSTQNVTISDSVAPTITFAGNSTITKNNTSGTCGYEVLGLSLNPTVTDDCDVVSFTHNFTSWNNPNTLEGATFPIGTTQVIWTAIDSSGNTATYTQTIIVQDTQNPTFVNCPTNQTFTIGIGANCTNGTSWPVPYAQDNCAVTVTQTSGPTNGSDLVVGTYIISYLATDTYGNTATCSFTINVTDQTNPVVYCPGSMIVNSSTASCDWTSPAGSLTPLVFGDCPTTVTWTVTNPDATTATGTDDVSGYVFLAGVSAVNYTITDANNVSQSCNFTIKVVDLIDPTITVPADLSVVVDSNCDLTSLDLGTPTTADNCSVVSVTNNAPAVFPIGTTIVTWTVTDAAANTATAIQTVVVQDTTAPILNCVTNSPIVKNTTFDNCGFIVEDTQFDPTAAENCTLTSLTHNYTQWTNPYSLKGATFPVGTTTIVWTAIDASGNTSTCTYDVVVNDIEVPVFLNCPSNATFIIGSDSNCTDGNAWPVPVAQDNCAVTVTQTQGPSSNTALTIGTHLIEYTATDASGNSTTCSFTIVVTDSTLPTVYCPESLEVNSDLNSCTWTSPAGSLTPLAFGECPKLVTWTITNPSNVVTNGLNDVSGVVFQPGLSTVTYTVTDVNNVVVTCSFTVTVIDNTNPSITAPSNLVIAADAQCGATSSNIGTPIVYDQCSAVTVTNDAPATLPLGTNIITWTATDTSGNSTSVTQTVIVKDYIAPILNITDIDVDASASCGATNIDFGVTASDNCSIESLTNNAPSFFPIGVTTITWTAIDGSGNTTIETQNITVVDVTSPVIFTPADVVLSATTCFATNVVLTTPVVSDNCTIASVTNNAPVEFPIGTTVVVWTVTDGSGNTATTTQNVIISDTTYPTITAPAAISVNANNPCFAYNVNIGNAITSDNCSVASVVNNAPTIFPVGETIVVWTVTDTSGNSTSVEQLVTVIDLVNPTIIAPQAVTVSATANCGVSGVDLGTPVTLDNCYAVASVTNNAPLVFPLGTTTVTWTVTDGSGNTATATQTVTVVDTILPTISAPANITMSTNNGCTATNVVLGLPITADNCSVATVTNNAPAVFPIGTTSVIWTVTDASGNIKTATQTVTVFDGVAPTITVPADLTINANNSCVAFNVNLGTPTTADNCSVASVTNNAPTVFELGETIVIWTVTDASGNSTSVNQTVTVVDTVIPVIIAPAAITVYSSTNCGVLGVVLGSPITSDNCSISSVTNNAPVVFPAGTTTVIWTVTDASGNTATANQLVTVLDLIFPTITAPANITLTTNNGCTATDVVLGSPITSDNCSIASVTNNAPTVFPIGTTSVIWTVTDGSGNSVNATQLVTVNDTVSPTLTAPNAVSVNANGSCVAFNVNLGTPIASDNCSSVSVTNNAPAVFPIGTTVVTWTATDSSNNITTATQVVTVLDTINPTITAPLSVSVALTSSCGATGVVLGNPTTADNCSVVSVTNNAPATFLLGDTTVVWTVTDASGNTATANQTVTVVDNQLPTITAPSNISVFANSSCTATGIVLGAPMVSDNCTVVSITNNAPLSYPLGVTTVTWTATDNSGNIETATQTVTVLDNINPTIVAPLDLTFNANNVCSAFNVNLGTPVTSDNCSVASVVNNAPTIFPIGITSVTWTVTDGSGNTATATQTVTVIDTISPSILAPSAVTVATNNGCTAENVILGNPITSDNCTIASVTNNAPTLFPIGTTTVTWTVTDGSGNTSTATQTVTVIDTILPTIAAPSNITMSTNNGCTATNLVLGLPITADNCSVATVTNNAPAVFPIGTTTVIWTVTDASGNTSTANQTVTVFDTIAPSIIAASNIVVNANSNCFGLNVSIPTPVTSDNCSVVSVTNNAPATFPIGVTTIEWTATDASGNTTTAIQTVTVVDATPPTIATPLTVTINSNSDNCFATNVVLDEPFAFDNCTSVTLTNNAPLTFPLGLTVITWTATDAGGNTATVNQNVIVTDTTAPTVNVQNVTVALDINGNATINASQINNGSTDNCGIQSVTVSPMAFTCANIGANTVILTVTDLSGNSTTATATVTVVDNINPIAIAQNISVSLDEDGEAIITADMINNGSTDNCSLASIEISETYFNCDSIGDNTIVLTVVDAYGNTTITNAIVTVTNSFNDSDNDGISDNCDDDDDNDGVEDVIDNCPFTFNTAQLDNDNDGIGDICDDDDDNDGVLDTIDNCPLTYNPDQLDRDENGVGDACDLDNISISEALSPNGDGINDTWMIYNIENHPNSIVRVFNRWGSQVFYSRNYQNNWDGSYKNNTENLPEGASYYYQIDLDGNGIIDKEGWLYITRF